MKNPITESVFCSRCGLINCICGIHRDHRPGCLFLRAASLSIEIACEHGLQACPKCDPCDCGIASEIEGIR